MVLDELCSMSADDFHRVRSRDDYDVSADWVVFHLIDHEVEHSLSTLPRALEGSTALRARLGMPRVGR